MLGAGEVACCCFLALEPDSQEGTPPEGAELPPLTAVAGGLEVSAEGLAPSADELELKKN